MQKRTKFAIVLLIGLILLALGLWLLLSPLLHQQNTLQPPPLPPSNPAEEGFGKRTYEAPIVIPATSSKPTVSSGMLALQNFARGLAERMGTGTSGNGFLGYEDVKIDATSNGRIALQAARKNMQTLHPASIVFGVTSKAVTAKTDSGVYGDDSITISMDVLTAEDAGKPELITKTIQSIIVMKMSKQDNGSYLLDSFTWK